GGDGRVLEHCVLLGEPLWLQPASQQASPASVPTTEPPPVHHGSSAGRGRIGTWGKPHRPSGLTLHGRGVLVDTPGLGRRSGPARRPGQIRIVGTRPQRAPVVPRRPPARSRGWL